MFIAETVDISTCAPGAPNPTGPNAGAVNDPGVGHLYVTRLSGLSGFVPKVLVAQTGVRTGLAVYEVTRDANGLMLTLVPGAWGWADPSPPRLDVRVALAESSPLSAGREYALGMAIAASSPVVLGKRLPNGYYTPYGLQFRSVWAGIVSAPPAPPPNVLRVTTGNWVPVVYWGAASSVVSAEPGAELSPAAPVDIY